MANLKEIRLRITSVGSTMQITSAMKMVSAAKLKRAQDAIVQMRPYANKLTELLENLSASLDSSDGGIYSQEREIKNVLLVTVTSNRGLCGGFNAYIMKKAKALINDEYANANVGILSIGKKSSEHFSKNGFNVVSTHDALFGDLTFENVAKVADGIMQQFVAGNYDKVILVYNQFKNAATQIIMAENFLPVQAAESEGAVVGDYLFEPTKQEIVEELIPKSLKT
ncbi:MAG: ATP synthase F1 subunit gamma, partial [Flavobacteriales bacterium]|nr:ATP synthase F1 subunit gamma [Flavobacteriales bacterium]